MSKRIALITGGTRGIGLGIAEALGREGFDLCVCGLRPSESAEESLSALRKTGAQVLYVRADVGSKPDRSGLLQAIETRYGALHVLVNNAGVAPEVRADILEAGEESFERLMRINLQGPYFLTQAAANWMIRQKKADPAFQGSVINVTSVSAEVASTSRGDYCVSKAGLSMAVKLFAARLGKEGIPVYEIRPGLIQTDMTSGVQSKYDALIAGGLLVEPRWGQPADVGKAVAMLARGDLPYGTGSVLHVDGGLTLPRL
jgi:NAD(P)-dependent dehydrogenase (short-subunit alcohol dehydrogenase family)